MGYAYIKKGVRGEPNCCKSCNNFVFDTNTFKKQMNSFLQTATLLLEIKFFDK